MKRGDCSGLEVDRKMVKEPLGFGRSSVGRGRPSVPMKSTIRARDIFAGDDAPQLCGFSDGEG